MCIILKYCAMLNNSPKLNALPYYVHMAMGKIEYKDMVYSTPCVTHEMIAGMRGAKPNWSFSFNIWKKIAEWIVFVQFNFNSEFYNYVEFGKYTRFVTSATWMNENEWISIYLIFTFFFVKLTIPFCNFKRIEMKKFHYRCSVKGKRMLAESGLQFSFVTKLVKIYSIAVVVVVKKRLLSILTILLFLHLFAKGHYQYRVLYWCRALSIKWYFDVC